MLLKSGRGRTEWNRLLPAECFAYRDSIYNCTGHTPFQQVFGREVKEPLKLTRDQWIGADDYTNINTRIHGITAEEIRRFF